MSALTEAGAGGRAGRPRGVGTAGSERSATSSRRNGLRSVALPSEHGGWGLTLEPAVLGLAVAPSAAGACLGAAALLAFVARTPLKIVLVDRWRGRALERTRLAGRVAGIELALVAAVVVAAVALADTSRWWIPLAVAAPLFAVELWFDMRSRSRRLTPELAGAVGIGAVAAAIALADGSAARSATGLWLIVAARAISAIPHVRNQIARLHGRGEHRVAAVLGDVAALASGATAAILDRALIPGAVAIAALVAVQRVTARGPVPPAKVLGLRQMALGSALVAVTSAGFHLT